MTLDKAHNAHTLASPRDPSTLTLRTPRGTYRSQTSFASYHGDLPNGMVCTLGYSGVNRVPRRLLFFRLRDPVSQVKPLDIGRDHSGNMICSPSV